MKLLLTKPQVEELKRVVGNALEFEELKAPQRRALLGIVERIERSELLAAVPAAPRVGLGVREAVSILSAHGVVPPPAPSPAWWARVSQKLSSGGYTAEHLESAARAARRSRRFNSVDYVIWNLDQLIATDAAPAGEPKARVVEIPTTTATSLGEDDL